MSRSIERFVEAFVRPMLAGGRVVPQPPYSTVDRDELAREAGVLASADLVALRLVRAQALLPHPPMADPTAQDLSMWLGLHNLTFLDHPQAGRVWTTARKWELVERETRALFEYARPVDLADAVARHVAVSSLIHTYRDDRGSLTAGERPDAPRELPGRVASTRAPARGAAADAGQGGTRWIHAPHARPVARLWPVVLWASPLTTFLDPTIAPPSWAPSTGAGFLRHRGLARAIVFGWARKRDWVEIGRVVAGAALQEMGLLPTKQAGTSSASDPVQEPSSGLRTREGSPLDVDAVTATGTSAEPTLRLAAPRTDPAALLHVFAALVHLHVVKLLEFDARVVPARDPATQAFLAMPLLLRTLAPRLGDPFAGVHDVALTRRWDEHVEHLEAIVPGELVASIAAAVGPAVTPRRADGTPSPQHVEALA